MNKAIENFNLRVAVAITAMYLFAPFMSQASENVIVVDLLNNAPKAPEALIDDQFSSEDINQYIPTDIPDGSQGSIVGAKILDQSLNTLVKKAAKKNQKLARAAKTMTKGLDLKTEFSLGGNDTKSPNAINHKVSFQAKVLNSMATVKYSGLINAALTYKAALSETSLELQPELNTETDLIISQVVSPIETMSYLKLQMNY